MLKKHKKQEVLLVDDSDICCISMKLLFKEYCPNYELLPFLLGEEAKRALTKYPTNKKLIILDLMLRDMSGLDLYEYIKTSDSLKDIPVIFQSGREINSEEEEKILKLNNGQKVIKVRKPYSIRNFLPILKSILGEDAIKM